MTPKTYAMTVRKTVRATPEEVFRAWSDPDRYNRVHGSHETRIDWRVGGTIATVFWADKDVGETFEILALEESRRMVFCWQGHEAHRVTLEATPVDEGVQVAITQECHDNPGWITNVLDGWAWVLDSLELVLDTGEGIANDVWTERYGTHRVVPLRDQGQDDPRT